VESVRIAQKQSLAMGIVVPGFNDDSFTTRVAVTALIVLFVVLLLTLE
jgi:hypothetical protein